MRLFTLRGPVLRVPWPLVIVAWLGRGGWLAAGWLWRSRAAQAFITATAGLWYVVSTGRWWPLLLALGGALLAAGWWAEGRGVRSWAQLTDALEERRRLRGYRDGWEDVMDGVGLVRVGIVPTLLDVRLGGEQGERDLDLLTVQMPPGQVPEDWRAVAVRLAAAWNRQRVRTAPVAGRADQVELAVRHGRVTGTSRRPPAWRPLEPGEEQPRRLEAVPDVPQPATRPGAFPRTPRGAA